MSQVLATFMTGCHTRADRALEQALARNNSSGDSTSLHKAMGYSLFNGGKRVRPILAYASGLAVSAAMHDESWARLDQIACALECVHAYSLVHDDLPAMDDDALRRGKPTCHIAFDEATAILAGDALQTLAFELLCEANEFPPQVKVALLSQLALAAGGRGMVLGQALDLAAVDHELTLAQLETMHRHKTGALIRASVTMGATACGATPAQLTALETYAAAVGLAFQVQDDILDVTADTATLGKQQGADIARNKPTYVSLLGLAVARQKALDLHQQALDALSDFDEKAELLRLLSAYIVERGH
jgi:farnesyl diphosphate synthase/geranylgeranyl diphosphate synthase type II